ncbi:MAG: hypothetical protein WD668_09500 [Saccharospirillum sp.]
MSSPRFDKFKAVLHQRQPKMTRYCDQKGLPYPELDEDGDMIPPTDAAYRGRT